MTEEIISALNYAQRNLGKRTRPDPIDRVLAKLSESEQFISRTIRIGHLYIYSGFIREMSQRSYCEAREILGKLNFQPFEINAIMDEIESMRAQFSSR